MSVLIFYCKTHDMFDNNPNHKFNCHCETGVIINTDYINRDIHIFVKTSSKIQVRKICRGKQLGCPEKSCKDFSKNVLK